MKKQTKPVKLINPLNQEIWLSPDYTAVKSVEGIDYILVYKPDTPQRQHLMRKDALRRVS